MIVYADLLYLIDASMDFLTLFLCGKCTGRKTSVIRLLLGAFTGAFGSVLLLYLPQNGIFTVLMSVLFSCLMVLLTFGKMGGILPFLRQCVLVWGCGALAGGILTILLSLGTPVYLGTPKNHSYPTAFVFTVIVCLILIRLFTYRINCKTAEIIICRGESTERVTALVDSGNLITEPLSGRPVLLVSEAAIKKLYPVICVDNLGENRKIRLIPSRTISGEKLLYGIAPDAVRVNGKPKDIILVVEDVPEDHYGGYGALCPGGIVQ